MDTGYSASVSNIEDRPPSFSAGFFAQDFVYSSGDLDIHNGRYCKTPEYPDGTYAYFVGVTTNFATGKLDPKYPYFIGDSYKSNPTVVDEVGKINQDYDFNNSNLIRNSFPYKVSENFVNNDFISEYMPNLNKDENPYPMHLSFSELKKVCLSWFNSNKASDGSATKLKGISADIERLTKSLTKDIENDFERHDEKTFGKMALLYTAMNTYHSSYKNLYPENYEIFTGKKVKYTPKENKETKKAS